MNISQLFRLQLYTFHRIVYIYLFILIYLTSLYFIITSYILVNNFKADLLPILLYSVLFNCFLVNKVDFLLK